MSDRHNRITTAYHKKLSNLFQKRSSPLTSQTANNNYDLGHTINQLTPNNNVDDEDGERRAGTKTAGGRSLSLSPSSLSKILNERSSDQNFLSNSPTTRWLSCTVLKVFHNIFALINDLDFLKDLIILTLWLHKNLQTA